MPQETEQQTAKRQRNDKPLNNLGRVIQRRKEMNISQEKIGAIVGVTRQAWSKIEKRYEDTAEKYSQEGIYDYPFSYAQMRSLNQLFEFSSGDALVPKNAPMAFDEGALFESLVKEAVNRDRLLVWNTLERICSASEKDLQILQQTVDIILIQSSSDTYAQSALLLSALKNAVSQSIHAQFQDDAALNHIYKKNVEKSRIWAKKKEKLRIKRQFWNECKKEYEKQIGINEEQAIVLNKQAMIDTQRARLDAKQANLEAERVKLEAEQAKIVKESAKIDADYSLLDPAVSKKEIKRRFAEEIERVLEDGRYESKDAFNVYFKRRMRNLLYKDISRNIENSIKTVIQRFLDHYIG